ncbi:ElyC/SanA/YdcF family protein [Loigolactobacillus zhaoyuanensis]|uniref:ElyC/SanA/YdcF family protein n=1 Tax=Loigolactobacillus zhaoyuanensis TaxID=2486017 RepID=A0ABW8UC75_9LACO|nr:ElyC/SanA/YdcF family protein [Loigolactobacillus zhaoyuanensis]
MAELAEQINSLGQFCGRRDITELSQTALRQAYNIDTVDVFAFFGGSIVAGVATLAAAIQAKIARHYVIVGGHGHTTAALIKNARACYPEIDFDTSSEAQIFNQILHTQYGLSADFLETESTNCGNNITNLLALLTANNINCRSIILCQDATLQLRMAATMAQQVTDSVKVINYAAYAVSVVAKDDQLTFDQAIPGMWSLNKYVSLLLGEIQRLTDDQNGYGPAGKNYLAHVDVPALIQTNAHTLQQKFTVRTANPLFATELN